MSVQQLPYARRWQCGFIGELHLDLREAGVTTPLFFSFEPELDELGDAVTAGFADETQPAYVVCEPRKCRRDLTFNFCQQCVRGTARPAADAELQHAFRVDCRRNTR